VKRDIDRRDNEGGSNQNLILFMRGKAISGAPIIMGTNQFPNPPIIIGITIKKIITKACAVTITLYWCSVLSKVLVFPNLIRMYTLIDAPSRAAQNPNIKYNVPISL